MIMLSYGKVKEKERKCKQNSFKNAFVALIFAICIKLQTESMHFALQNDGFCKPICSILQAKMQGFATKGHLFS